MRISPSTERSLPAAAGLVAVAVAAGCATLPADQHEAPMEPIDIPALLSLDRRLSGSLPRGLRWLDDARYLAYGRPEDAAEADAPRRLLVVDAVTGEKQPLYDVDVMARAFAALPVFDERSALRLASRRSYTFLPDHVGVLISHRGTLYRYHFGASAALRLTGKGRVDGQRLSPDGKWVAYRRKHDLHLVAIDGGPERRLTRDGSKTLLNGRLDWVYQEEIYGRGNWNGFWWSPDSARIAFLQLDETPVREYPVVNHMPVRARTQNWYYPKSGDPNPKVRVGCVPAAGGPVTWVDLSEYPEDDRLVVRLDWTPGGDGLLLQVTNRIQNRLDLLVADPQTGVVTRLLREDGIPWVHRSSIKWLDDDRFLWFSTRDGFKHLYVYRADGTLERQLTEGPFEVLQLLGVDDERAVAYAITNEGNILGRQLWRIPLDGSPRERMTDGRGIHRVRPSKGLKLAFHRRSDAGHPGVSRLISLPDNTEVRALGEGRADLLVKKGFIEPEFFQVPLEHGFVMEGAVYKPPGFTPGGNYPTMIWVYGGPHASQVRDSFGGFRSLWFSELARRGTLICVLDPQSASGKGDESAWVMYRRAGETELRDLEGGIDWLVEQGWTDPARVGVFGWSYGGFMASYCVTHSKRFRLAIAGASVTDWRNYDSIYTERYMSTPQDNPDGYEKSSVVKAAKDLHGDLLLIHGTLDENVHLANTLQLAEALQRAGKPFRMMLYPNNRHRIGRRGQREHLYRMMTEFILEKL